MFRLLFQDSQLLLLFERKDSNFFKKRFDVWFIARYSQLILRGRIYKEFQIKYISMLERGA